MSDPSESPVAGVEVLAAKRTNRPDPLNCFRMYDGGWNLTNISYLASAGFTGMPGFVISLLWIITGFGVIIVVSCMSLCCKENLKPHPNFDRVGNYTTLGLLVIFTVITIAGCGAFFSGQEGLHSDLSTVFTYMTNQFTVAANASVSSAPPMAVPSAAQAAEAMEKATNSTTASIHASLDSIRIWLIILAASMLVFALIGLVYLWASGVAFGTVFVACQIKPVIYTLVTIGWLLIVATWILCGVALLINSVLGDTCVAMAEWADNPRSGTSFDTVMMCNSNSNLSRSHLSIGKLPPVENNNIQFTEYKFQNDVEQNDNYYTGSFNMWVKNSIQEKDSTPSRKKTQLHLQAIAAQKCEMYSFQF